VSLPVIFLPKNRTEPAPAPRAVNAPLWTLDGVKSEGCPRYRCDANRLTAAGRRQCMVSGAHEKTRPKRGRVRLSWNYG
jgi:hypothetical protein